MALGNEVDGGPEVVLRGHNGFGLVEFAAGTVRRLGLGVCRDPTPEHPWHALVFSRDNRNEIPKTTRVRLAEAAIWLVGPGCEPT